MPPPLIGEGINLFATRPFAAKGFQTIVPLRPFAPKG